MNRAIVHAEIGSFEAKTRLPELLRAVQQGKSYTITLRGRAIADLVPSTLSRNSEVAVGIACIQHMMKSTASLPKIDSKALLEEGRD